MHTTLPTQAKVDIQPFGLADNLVGLIQGVHAAMAYVLGDELPDELQLDELVAVSAVGFKNYVYETDFNQLENPQPYSALGELVCNYGPFESLSYYSGWDVKEFNGIARNDFWKLLQFEIASGRPVMTLGLGEGAVRPVLVVGYHYEPREQTLDVIEPNSAQIDTVDVTGLQDFQADEPSFTNWLLIVRPSEQPEWASSHTRQRLRVLRWAAKHARRHKEFSQETRDNYAPGLAGFQSFLGLLDRLADRDDVSRGTDAGLSRYLAAHVDGLIRARKAAARRLPVWSADFLSGSELDAEQRAAVEDALVEAADTYGELAARLSGWRDAHASERLVAGDLESLVQSYTGAHHQEKEAVEALERALEHLPGGF